MSDDPTTADYKLFSRDDLIAQIKMIAEDRDAYHRNWQIEEERHKEACGLLADARKELKRAQADRHNARTHIAVIADAVADLRADVGRVRLQDGLRVAFAANILRPYCSQLAGSIDQYERAINVLVDERLEVLRRRLADFLEPLPGDENGEKTESHPPAAATTEA